MSDIRSTILVGVSDGMMRKVSDVLQIQGLGRRATTSLMDGISTACEDCVLGIAE